MLLIPCPYCGTARPESEFRYGGQAHVARETDGTKASDADWEAFLYLRANPKGPHAERWRHVHGCGRFFNCVRDTVTDAILATYKAGEGRPTGGPDTAHERASRIDWPPGGTAA